LPEFTYPKGLLLRRVNNSGDISWHRNRVFISEVFRFEELAFELITPELYRVFFRDMEIGELTLPSEPVSHKYLWFVVVEAVGKLESVVCFPAFP